MDISQIIRKIRRYWLEMEKTDKLIILSVDFFIKVFECSRGQGYSAIYKYKSIFYNPLSKVYPFAFLVVKSII